MEYWLISMSWVCADDPEEVKTSSHKMLVRAETLTKACDKLEKTVLKDRTRPVNQKSIVFSNYTIE